MHNEKEISLLTKTDFLLSNRLILMKKLIIAFIISSSSLIAQDYPLAPEVWSEPIRIDSLSLKDRGERSPSLTQNLDTMYLFIADGIYMSVLDKGVWRKPMRLSNNVNFGGAIRNPSISKNGKRIYYSAWGGYGQWDIWYNDWDTTINDWGKIKNLGSKLNTSGMDWYLYEVSKDTLLILNDKVATPSPVLYVYDNQNKEWAITDSFSHHMIACCHVQGISMPASRKKIYYSDINFGWSGGMKKHYSELCVVYWDSTKNYWSRPYFININSLAFQPDTTNPFYWTGGMDEFPWISPDGKILYFSSSRDTAKEDSSGLPNIYVSYLLIDEKGNPVSVKKDETIPDGYKLYQNYPNPFNPKTKIRFTLPKPEKVNITIYDIRGRRIAELIDDLMTEGGHEIEFDSERYSISSGVYIYRLRTPSIALVKKSILIK